MGERRRVRLGEFEIIERIGSGGMGQVFKATQTSLDRVVALKLLPKSMARDRALVERLYREAKAAAKIVHPNVVQIYSVGEEHGVPYFAMEYVEGEDLEQKLSRGDHLTLQEIVDTVAAVSMALSAAGEHGIVHRDIKPGNIMIDKNGVVKVTDFGLAKPTTTDDLNITQAGYIVGTPTYMSPEQAEGGQVDRRSDIYSLGIVFYELLTGSPPFVADSPAALIYKHVHESPRLPSEIDPQVPPVIDAVVLKCLEKKPEDRYQDSSELLKDLVESRRTIGEEVSSTIVFDAAQARKWAGITPRTPMETKSEAPTQPEEPPVRKEGVGALTSIVAALAITAVLVAGVGGYFLYSKGFLGPEPEPQPPTGADTSDVTPDAPAPPSPPEPGRVAVDFSFLDEALPEGAVVLLIDDKDKMPLAAERITLKPGVYSVKIEHKGYMPKVLKLAVSKEGVNPEPNRETFSLEPRPELAEAYDRALGLFEEGRFQKALAALQEVSRYDPGFRDVPALARETRKILDEKKNQQQDQWIKAAEFYSHELYEDAITLLEKIPPEHPRFTDAQGLLKTAQDRLAELAKIRTAVNEALRKGDTAGMEQELAALAQIAGDRPQAKSFLERNREKLAKLRKLWDLYNKAESAEHQSKLITSILSISPQSEKANKEMENVQHRIECRQRALKLYGSAKIAFEHGDFEECRNLIQGSLEAWPEEMEVPRKELAEKARLAEIEHGLNRSLSSLEALLKGQSANAAVLGENLNPALIAAWKGDLAVTDLAFVLNDFKEKENEIVGNASLSFSTEGPGLPVEVRAAYVVSFTREGHIIKAVTLENGRSETGEEPDGALIKGKIIEVRGPLVTIEVPDPMSIPVGAAFRLYCGGSVYKLPLSDKVFLQQPRQAGQGRVIFRSAETLVVDTGQPVENLTTGDVAVYDPRLSAEATPPRVLSLAAAEDASHTSDPILIRAEPANIENRPVSYRWQASGGTMESSATVVPRSRWYPPSRQGDFELTVELVFRGGVTSSASVTVEGKGPRGALSTQYLVDRKISIGGGTFRGLGDAAFDDYNRPVLVDNQDRKAFVYNPEFAGLGLEFPLGRYQPAKIAFRKGFLYQLDAREQRIMVLRVPQKGETIPREPQLVTTIGERGTGNGTLTQPVDFAFLPEGQVAIADNGVKALLVFSQEGRFQYSLGTPGKERGQFDTPAAVAVDAMGDCHVLDSGRGVVMSYRGITLLSERVVPSREQPPVDLAYSAPNDALYVLYSSGHVLRLRGTDWKQVVAPGENLGSIKDPVALSADPAGSIYVIDRRGMALERFDGNGAFSGRLGGPVLDRPARVTCTSGKGILLLDPYSKVIARLDQSGFLMNWFGGREVLRSPSDIAGIGENRVMVLDDRNKEIQVFDVKSGNQVGSVGAAGRTPATELVAPVDLNSMGTKVLVLQGTSFHNVHVYGEDGGLEGSFPTQADQRLAAPLCTAADTDGRIFVAQRGRPMFVYSSDGKLLGQGKTEVNAPVDMEVTADGTVVVVDAHSRTLLVTAWRDGKLQELQLDIKEFTRSPLDAAADDFGGIFVMTQEMELIRLVPSW